MPAPPAAAKVPATAREPVTDKYHDVVVQDDYRWLEESGSDRVRAWTAAQNAHTRDVLDRLPERGTIAARVRQVLSAPQISYRELQSAGDRWFVLVRQPPKPQPYLVALAAGSDPALGKVILDPTALDASGKTAIDWFVPSPDGSKVAVSLSKGGSESGDLTVIDVLSGTQSDAIPRVNGGTAGGDIAWLPDNSGFYYTRYPAPGERPEADLAFFQQLYFHKLGTPLDKDRYELGRELPRIAEIQLDLDNRTGRLLATVANGDGGQFSHFLRTPQGKWRKLTDFDQSVVQIEFGANDDLFAVSRKDAPLGVILRIDGKALDVAHAKRVYAADKDALVTAFAEAPTLVFGAKRWYATFQQGGPSIIRAFDYSGNPQPLAAPFEVGAMSELTRDRDGLLFRAESYLDPSAWFRIASWDDTKPTEVSKTSLAGSAPVDLHDYKVTRESARSADGTQVPFTVLSPPTAKRDFRGAAVVTGYGGFGVSLTPGYRASNALFLERGVTLVVANLRGGGELGDAWHRAGNLTKKQNVFDDFSAVLKRVLELGYAAPERLGITGGSNGGLLVGATEVQHPELAHAVVSSVGLYDMLRSELSPNGAFVTMEYGSVKDREQFTALHAYSPYHHVRDGVAYPSTLLLSGENDPRVDPMQSRKFVARLQAASTHPALLRISANAGHGVGADLEEQISQQTDAMTFLIHELGVSVL